MGKTDLQELVVLAEKEAEKAFLPAIQRQTVVDSPAIYEARGPSSSNLVFSIAAQADEFIPWGVDLKGRDQQLRGFWHTEPILASAVYMMAASLAVMNWRIDGSNPRKPRPKNTIMAVEKIFNNADRGNGWHEFMMKLAIDLYTQDNGGFIELIRIKDRPDSPVIGFAHLDSYRCHRTGDPETPVIYDDRFGRQHELKWWHVQTIEEMPSPVESMYGAQVCAVSRCLAAAQVIRDIRLFKHEKVSGLNPRALHFVSGVSQDNVLNGLRLADENAINRGLTRYVMAPVITTIDPTTSNLSHVQVDLASLPDGFDEQTTLQWYVAQLAMAFGVDYQEFAPLPGGSLGSSQQSEIMHLKSKSRGPSLMINTMEHLFNDSGIIPRNVKFEFTIQDPRVDAERAAARFDRGKDRSVRIASGELDIEAARKVAEEDGDITPDVAADLESRPVVVPPKPQTQVGQTADQPMQGSQSHDQRKSLTHKDRASVIARMQERGVIKLPSDLPEITDADLEEAQALLENTKEMTENGPVRRLGDNLAARVHETFTLNADQWLAQGLLDQNQRIQLSNLIGEALRVINEGIPEEVAQIDLDDTEPAIYHRADAPEAIPSEVSLNYGLDD